MITKERLAEIERLRSRTGKVSDRAVQELIAEVRRLKNWQLGIRQLFAGGPDTPCATSWRLGDGAFGEITRTECVEIPMEDLRQALGEDEA
jgi:hypothetical protein